MTYSTSLDLPDENSEYYYFGEVVTFLNFDDKELFCLDCKYYNNNIYLPCAVNPNKVYNADDCSDYSEVKD